MPPLQPAWNLKRVFGREKESSVLKDLIHGSTNVRTTILLHGVAGSGKSALMNSQPWQEMGWTLATGKFEKHRMGEPFSAVIELLKKLVKKHKDSQKSSLSSLQDEDLGVLKNILPKSYFVDKSVDGHPEQNSLSKGGQNSSLTMGEAGEGAADYVRASLGRIVAVLCQDDPAVLFLDDIHWADESSLNLLKHLANGNNGDLAKFVLVISYRDEDIEQNELAVATLDEIKTLDGKGSNVKDIPIGNMDVESVNHMVASLTQRTAEETMPLASVIHKKTSGNAFFVSQFLRMLRYEDFLTYSFQNFKWEWGDIERLEHAAHVADNVADVVARTMERLPEDTRVALSVAACLGKLIPLEILVEYFAFYKEAESGYTCSHGLHQIELCGLEAVLDDAVAFGVLIKSDREVAYIWAHDKLQQIAYSLIPDPLRASLHIKLGQILWRMSVKNPEEEWMVFMAADQMNRFSDHRQEQVLGVEVATLCHQAAILSISKSALYPAFDMLMAGIKHLDIEDRWTTHAGLSLKLYSTLAEVSMALGKRNEAMDAVAEVEENVKSYEDKFPAQCVKLRCIVSGADRNYKLGAEKTLEILKEYGVNVPRKLYPGQMYIENKKLKKALPGGKLEGLLDLPTADDSRFQQIATLAITYLCVFLFFTPKADLTIGWYASVQTILKSVEHGICEETAVAVSNLGWYMKTKGHYKEAGEYADLAVKLIRKFPMRMGSNHTAVIGLSAVSIFAVTKPLNAVMESSLEGHKIGLKTGIPEKATGSILAYILAYFSVGLPLGPLKSDVVSYEKEARSFHMPPPLLAVFQIVHQAVLNLQEDVENPTSLNGRAMNEDDLLNEVSGNGLTMTKRDLYTFRLLLAVFYGCWDVAQLMVDELEPFLKKDSFIVRASLRRTAMGLAAFQIARAGGKKKYRTLGKKLLSNMREELKRGNVNAHHVYLMLEAEAVPSKECYDDAIRSCARLGALHWEAYMCESAAKFFIEKGDRGWAEHYMSQAYVLFGDWGASGKANRLKKEHSELLKSTTLHEKGTTAMKGRSRYSAEDVDALKELNWKRLGTTGSRNSTVSSDSTSVTTAAETMSLQSNVVTNPHAILD